MKRRSCYIGYILFLTLLLLACSNQEEVLETMEKKTVMIPFSIKIGSNTIVSKAGNPLPDPGIEGDPCEADHLRIFVFKNTENTGSTQLRYFVYDKEGIVEKQPYASANDRMRYATGYFEAETNATYRIVGYAYKASEEKYLDFSGITTAGTTFLSATIGINKIADEAYYTPEFFSGTISDDPTKRDKVVSITDGTKIQLQGSLFRGVGQINVKVTNIPDDVTKLGLVMDRYSIRNDMIHPEFFIYTSFSKDTFTKRFIVDETNQIENDVATPANGRTAVLTENMLRLGDGNVSSTDNGGSLLYIDATTTGGTTTRYLVQCRDKMMEDPFTPVLYEYLIISSRFVIPTNWRMTISGDFSKLQHGTLKMEINDITANGFFAGMME